MRARWVTTAVAAAFSMVLTAAPASADLILLTDVQLSGQGIGAQLTVITLQSPAASTFESGQVLFDGSITGDVQPGASQSQTFTLADVGLEGSADPGSQLALVVNLSEPGSEDPPSVTTADPFAVTLTVYSSTGTSLGTFSADSGIVLDQVAGGVGGSGLVFGLDAAQAAAFNALISGTAGTEVLALSASFANASGGLDVIQAASLTGPTVIPEPATLLLLGTGLAGVLRTRMMRRR